MAAGLCWSADSFQLAGFDASSNLKLWWMVAEKQPEGVCGGCICVWGGVGGFGWVGRGVMMGSGLVSRL